MRLYHRTVSLFMHVMAIILLSACAGLNHDATNHPSTSISATMETPVSPNHVVLMLPMSGPMARAGKAVQQGFMSQIDVFERQGFQSPKITTLDTGSEKSISEPFMQAEALNPDLIIGPLTKSGVDEVAHIRPRVPLIALNRPSVRGVSFYHYALTPEDDGQALARILGEQNIHNVLVVRNQNPASVRQLASFTNAFKQTGGNVSNTLLFDSMRNFSENLRKFLQIDLAEKKQKEVKLTENRKAPLSEFLQLPNNVDAVVLFTSAEETKWIKSLFKFYYATEWPIYVSSTVTDGLNFDVIDTAYDDIYVVDGPWMLSKQFGSAQKRALKATFPLEYAENQRLFAFGADAALLAYQLESLESNHVIHGGLGTLSLQEHRIVREPKMGQFQNGSVRLIQE